MSDLSPTHDLSVARRSELERLCVAWKVKIHDLDLLDQALTHPSFRNEAGLDRDNQRLEYLGDSVLGLVVNEYLYQIYPDQSEGDLARIKSHVVAEAPLAEIARRLELGRVLKLGRGERNTGGRERVSNLADAYEAVVAAVYLDLGMQAARDFILEDVGPLVHTVSDPGDSTHSKSLLQELVQKRWRSLPTYELVGEEGPDHAPTFEVAVWVDGRLVARGTGRSRRAAERDAAERALKVLGGEST